MELTFDIDIPGQERCTKSIVRPIIKIGHDTVRCQIAVTGQVGKSHALIEGLSHDVITLSDLGMFTGTKVNGQKIFNGKVNLKLGDVISVGDSKITLVRTKMNEDEKVYTPPAVTAKKNPVELIDNSNGDVSDAVASLCLPSWLQMTPGFTFTDADGDGDLVIVLGPGNFNKVVRTGIINLDTPAPKSIFDVHQVYGNLIATTLDKDTGNWYMWDLSLENEDFWAACKPL